MNYIETTADTNGDSVKLYYNDYGKGNPVILIHGWPLSSAMWEYQIADLVNSGHRVIAYDRRGFGKSSQPWDGYDYDTMTDDLKAVIDHLKLEHVTLVGFSMGGGEVVRYFSRHGGAHVSKIVLIASITPYMLQTDSNPDGVPKETFDDMASHMQDDRIAFLDDFGKTFFGVNMLHKPISNELMNYFHLLGSMASPRATTECAKAFATTDFRQEMQSITVPALIIHGDADRTVPIEATGKQAAGMIAGSQFIIYDRAPHGLFYTEKERLNTDLINFLSDEYENNIGIINDKVRGACVVREQMPLSSPNYILLIS